MRRLPILKIIVQIVFAFCILLLFFGFPLLLVVAIMPDKIPFELDGNIFEAIFILASLLLGLSSFTYGLYLLKRVLELFGKKKFFASGVITFFDQSGKAFIAAGILWIVPPFFYKLLAENELELGINLGLPLFALFLGFFLMVLSEVFLIVKAQKEENDLTE